MTANPVLDHLLELRGTLVRAMKAKKIPADMFNDARERIAALDASLTEMGYDVSTEVQVHADKTRRKAPPVPVKRQIRRRMRNREDSFTAKLRKHFGVKA